MPLSVDLLQTQTDCNLVLEELNDTVSNLEFRRLSLERNRDNAAQRASTLDADLASAQAELDSLDSIIAALPDGPTKTEMQNRRRRTDFRLFSLQQRRQQFGTTAVVLYEAELAEVGQRIASLAASVAEVEARRDVAPA